MHFNWDISIGNVITASTFIILAATAWRDVGWRLKNLEIWRREHSEDSEARDKIINRMDKILYHLSGGK